MIVPPNLSQAPPEKHCAIDKGHCLFILKMQLSEAGMFLPEEVVKSPGNQDQEEGKVLH